MQNTADGYGNELTDELAGLTLFADLGRPQLEAVAHTLEEEWFEEGRRVLRQGFSGASLFIILNGEASVVIDGRERGRLGRGEFFGELSLLLGEPPTADVIVTRPLHCLVLAGGDLEQFLTTYPQVMFRMLQYVARRLRSSLQWQA